MAVRDITSANSTAVMVVDTIFPIGFALEAYATDQSLSMGKSTIAETRMGVDGYMSAGFVPNIKTMTISFEQHSSSIKFLNQLYQLTEANRTIYEVTLVVTVPSVKKTYTFTGGVLKTAKPFADHKKVLDTVSYTFDFERMITASI